MDLALNPARTALEPGTVHPQKCIFTKRSHFRKATFPESIVYPMQNLGLIPRRSNRLGAAAAGSRMFVLQDDDGFDDALGFPSDKVVGGGGIGQRKAMRNQRLQP